MNDPMFPPRPTALAHTLLRSVVQLGDLAIDATAGNGHDTAFLADCVGATGRVLAFDVQESALTATRERVAEQPAAVEFFLESHAGMAAHAAAGSVAAVMFNLGYLPGDDHQLTTEAAETLLAGGALSVVCYPGHLAGAAEAQAVENWMAALAGDGWRVAKYGAMGTRRAAPFLLLAAKK